MDQTSSYIPLKHFGNALIQKPINFIKYSMAKLLWM